MNLIKKPMSSSLAPARPGAYWPIALTADPGTQVLLLEAGRQGTAMPGIQSRPGSTATSSTRRSPGSTRTEPLEALGGRRMQWPRGKVLGGSSSINGLIYIRGQRQDFDHWRQLGNAGWSYDDVAALFPPRRETRTRLRRVPRHRRAARGHRQCAPTTSCTTPLSPPARRPATSSTPISTAPSRKASHLPADRARPAPRQHRGNLSAPGCETA